MDPMPFTCKITLTTVYLILIGYCCAISDHLLFSLAFTSVISGPVVVILKSTRTHFPSQRDRHHVTKQHPFIFRKGKQKPAIDNDTKEPGPSTKNQKSGKKLFQEKRLAELDCLPKWGNNGMTCAVCYNASGSQKSLQSIIWGKIRQTITCTCILIPLEILYPLTSTTRRF